MMKLNPIGIGSAFAGSELKNNSWYMVIEKTLYVFDCPYTNIEWFVKNKSLINKVDKIYIFITHMHEDHIGGLSNLSWWLYSQKKEAWVFAPNTIFIYVANYLELTNSCLPNIKLTQGEYYQDDNVQIFPRIVHHIRDVLCYGYVIYGDTGFISETGNNWSIYYSGDSLDFADEDIVKSFIAQPVNKHIYHDLTYNAASAAHCYKDKITTAIPKALRSQITPMHLDRYGEIKKLKALGFDTEDLFKFIPEA